MKLSDYIKANYKSQAAFAKKIKKSQQSVSDYCRGVMPPRKVALMIVKVTSGQVTLDDLWHLKRA